MRDELFKSYGKDPNAAKVEAALPGVYQQFGALQQLVRQSILNSEVSVQALRSEIKGIPAEIAKVVDWSSWCCWCGCWELNPSGRGDSASRCCDDDDSSSTNDDDRGWYKGWRWYRWWWSRGGSDNNLLTNVSTVCRFDSGDDAGDERVGILWRRSN
jgi:hypothetical protein